jgi:acetyl-CoA carboxylase carboxyltransferase component
VDEYSRKYLNADIAVKEGYVDELINPSNTRRRIFDDLISLSNKNDYTRPKKKHSNIPL